MKAAYAFLLLTNATGAGILLAAVLSKQAGAETLGAGLFLMGTYAAAEGLARCRSRPLAANHARPDADHHTANQDEAAGNG